MIRTAAEFVSLRESHDPNDYRRAAHDDAPLDVWLEVIASFPHMKKWVVLNKTVPVVVIEALARDEDPTIRSVVAMKRKAPADVLRELSSDAEAGVRATVASNPNTPLDVLRNLTADREAFVAELARERLSDHTSSD